MVDSKWQGRLQFKKWRVDTVLFGKTFVYSEVIHLNLKMTPIKNGGFRLEF